MTDNLLEQLKALRHHVDGALRSEVDAKIAALTPPPALYPAMMFAADGGYITVQNAEEQVRRLGEGYLLAPPDSRTLDLKRNLTSVDAEIAELAKKAEELEKYRQSLIEELQEQ